MDEVSCRGRAVGARLGGGGVVKAQPPGRPQPALQAERGPGWGQQLAGVGVTSLMTGCSLLEGPWHCPRGSAACSDSSRLLYESSISSIWPRRCHYRLPIAAGGKVARTQLPVPFKAKKRSSDPGEGVSLAGLLSWSSGASHRW